MMGSGADVGQLTQSLERTLNEVDAPVESVTTETERLLEQRQVEAQAQAEAQRQAEDTKTQPPLNGTQPHGQGTVAVLDLDPAPDRPAGSDPAGSDTGEELIVGRARGEQREDGTYHGHITIASLFGNEILGVDTDPGETDAGPLDPIQQGILTPICDGSGNQICLTAVQSDSTTTEDGSTNKFSAAHATLGGAEGIDVGVAESNGNISDDGNCQTSHGDSTVADANVGGQAVADVAKSSTDSQACKGQAPTQTNSSSVIGLGGTGVPFPAEGCADGTPDTVTGIPTLAPVVCNADDTNTTQAAAPYGVRDALDVFVLDVGGSQVAKAGTAGSQSRAQAPPPQCSDKADNDGDGKVDAADPGCLSGPGGAYNPNDDNEADEPPATQCSDTVDNDGDGDIDAADPGCLSGPGGAYNPADDDESDNTVAGRGDRGGPGDGDDGDDGDDGGREAADEPECSDGVDNDGDGSIDRDDPGCLSGPGGTYNPDDDDESDRRVETGAATLPRTGADVLLILMAGVLMLGGGMELRRRTRGKAGA